MNTTNPFSGYIAWILPIFMWIYISYIEKSFLSFFILIVGIFVVAVNRASTDVMNLQKRAYKDEIEFLTSIPLWKWIFEITVFPYAILSIRHLICTMVALLHWKKSLSITTLAEISRKIKIR